MTKLILVTNDPSEQLLKSCDVPLSYLPLAVYLWELEYPNKYNQKLSMALRMPVKLKAMTDRKYIKRYNPVSRLSAEERRFAAFDECVSDIKNTFRVAFSELVRHQRVYKTDGSRVSFVSQIDRLS